MDTIGKEMVLRSINGDEITKWPGTDYEAHNPEIRKHIPCYVEFYNDGTMFNKIMFQPQKIKE